MKIAWFTPFSTDSAIGAYSQLACEALSGIHDVTIFAPHCDNLRSTQLLVRPFDHGFAVEALQGFDFVFYNIGDNYLFHGDILTIAFRHPGVMILHDVSILNLLNGYYLLCQEDVEAYRTALTNAYGSAACAEIMGALSNPERWHQLDFLRYNGVALIASAAKGILVHSKYHLDKLKSAYHGPSAAVQFPFVRARSPVGKTKRDSNKLLALTVGYVNTNKRVTQVVEAIGSEPTLQMQLRYVVAGKLDGGSYESKLRTMIADLGLKNCVTLNGYTPDDALEQLYQNADILINLRNPAIEGASWSLVEQMSYGKPVIVSNTGFYGEMPDDCVLKISTDSDLEMRELRQAIHWVLSHPNEAAAMGQRAQKLVEERFNPQQYADAVEQFMEHMEFLKPLEQLVARVAGELSTMGVTSNMSVCEFVADTVGELFLK